MRTRFLIPVAVAAAALAACSSTTSSHSDHGSTSPMTSMSMPSDSSSMPSMPSGPDMSMPTGNGLSATVNGYTLTVSQTPMTGMSMPIALAVSKNGKPVTAFDPEQTKLMHLYLIRSDLTGFQHLHPTMSSDGTWRATPSTLIAGSYRAYVQFVPHADAKAGALVLSRTFTVPGTASSASVPAPSNRAAVDGYTVTVAGTAKAGTETPLTITINKEGAPVTDLQPYLDTYAHVTAIRAGDLAFAHLHPTGTAATGSGGPTLTVHADLPEPGQYRTFIQFQTAGVLHTAVLTITAA